MNISFAKLGEEECDVCAALKNSPDHVPPIVDDKCSNERCQACLNLAAHLEQAKRSREAYKNDGESVKPGTIVRSADLQRVVMLPRLPGFKAACFTRRLVGFHQTFAPVGSYTTSNKVESVVWHEGTNGRKCEDIASAVMMALEKDRDFKTVLFYMDNCTGQNKNYALYTAIIDKVNSANIQADSITLKYLQAGHTFMSADSFHARTEKEMKRRCV